MRSLVVSHFFFNDTATTEICTLSLHDALPISYAASARRQPVCCCPGAPACGGLPPCSWSCCCCQPASPHTAGRRRPTSCPRRFRTPVRRSRVGIPAGGGSRVRDGDRVSRRQLQPAADARAVPAVLLAEAPVEVALLTRDDRPVDHD